MYVCSSSLLIDSYFSSDILSDCGIVCVGNPKGNTYALTICLSHIPRSVVICVVVKRTFFYSIIYKQSKTKKMKTIVINQVTIVKDSNNKLVFFIPSNFSGETFAKWKKEHESQINEFRTNK